ncbi:hypothetical protein F0L74_15230 [Chitinophaga agrisoli]|uniref:Uncharacterized protein n=1 Tax=Chitinophaga agrisoli TaxID=2607653 RepID=A0A5B2VXR0_9BACT|nr:hypothetical protein [Chitinophaga agrisoli]KAA2243825.1 hypothetical protein F0L74_15230 [Chitinophaga agrisoli]
MSKNELIADTIEAIVAQMFAIHRPLTPNASEYSLFYDPRKHEAWFIVIFFEDSNTTNAAIKNGVCYKMHTYLDNALQASGRTADINSMIFFESGARPVEKVDMDNLFQQLILQTARLKKSADEEPETICKGCGHDFDNHQLMCEPDTELSSMKGWITCPEEGCNCFFTWGANFPPQ